MKIERVTALEKLDERRSDVVQTAGTTVHHSALIPAALITLPHFAISSFRNAVS